MYTFRYSFATCTISSTIQAFARPGDVVLADENVNFVIQTGLNLSRAYVRYVIGKCVWIMLVIQCMSILKLNLCRNVDGYGL